MSALRHGSLEGQDLSLLKAGSSVLRDCDGSLVTMTGRNSTFGFLNVSGGAAGSPALFTYIGERDADGWIHAPEGGWISRPTRDIHINVLLRGGEVLEGLTDCDTHIDDWTGFKSREAKIIAFRPASLAHPAPEQVAEASGRDVVTDEWAEAYCALTNQDPDGIQGTFMQDGYVETTFREKAKRQIEAMLASDPRGAS